MNYPEGLADKIGFSHVQADIKAACLSPMGVEFAEKMRFSNRFPLVKQWVNQVHEMKQLMAERGGEWPQVDYYDLRPWLAPLTLEGNYLSADQWRDWQRGLEVLYQCIRFFHLLDSEAYPELHQLTRQFSQKIAEKSDQDYMQLLPVLQELSRVFDANGQIKENASSELGEIRRKKNAEEQGLRKKLDSLLNQAQQQGWISKDFSLTLRNGRMVIPLAAEHKRKIKGFVQDESDTGKTVFLEPADALTANNEIKSLESAEKREIIQILSRLSDRVRPLVPMLGQWLQWLGLIDFIRAKAIWAQEHQAILPHLAEKPSLDWRNARHPLLEKSLEKIGKKIKPLSILLDEKKRLMVVSGPNAGGKSVTLSTVGLLQYLYQSGCLVPIEEGSSMGFFQQIFLDMGDEQNIENELSTYSSHLSNMRYFLQHANAKTLILVDEFGTGTEPSLGGAIAEAILEKLSDKGCYGAINTHFGNLKSLADRKEGLFNAAMRYDTAHLEPLFILDMGKPGSSFAFEIAQKIGLPTGIIENARKKLGKKQVDFDKLLLETETEKQIWQSKNHSLSLQNEQVDAIKQQYEQLKSHLQEEQKNIINKAKAEAKLLVKEANQRIEQTIREIKEKAAGKEETKQLREKLDDFAQKALVEAPVKPKVNTNPVLKAIHGPITVGDWVAIQDGGSEPTIGQVLEIKGKDALLALGSISTTIKLKRLQKVQAPKSEKTKTSPLKGIDINDRMAQFSLTLDLRGKRGEEVWVSLDQYINDVLLLGAPEVRILHGKGDGILRNLVREQLKRYAQIKQVQDEHADRGGAGISVVTMK
ncbi:endonuclease MutS2 [Aquirufa sp. Wall-65K1]